jgi:hypothetical protein
LRDTIELELRGVPTALIATTGRLVDVVRSGNEFVLSHAFADKIYAAMDSPWAIRQMAKFGYHRALRIAGCDEGNLVHLSGREIRWHFPTVDDERTSMPAGFGKWCSNANGIRDLQTIMTADPIFGLDQAEIAQRADELLPEIISTLTG